MKYFDIQRPPVAGTFTVGMKQLTQTALNGRGDIKPTPRAKEIYDQGIRSGASWKEIETALRAAGPHNKFPLVPKNTLYFTLFQDRCVMPGIADMMLKKYGEVRAGDSEPRVYEFPIVFFSDTLEQICATGFKSWKNTRLDRFSAVDPGTGERHCITYAKVEKLEKAKRGRAPKVWGGRQKKDLGLCDPNECDIFRDGECAHEATLYFRVPGVPTGSMYLTLTTKSIFSLLDFVGDPENPNDQGILGQALRDFGRLSGLFHGKPLFWLSKSVDTIHRTDWLKGTQVKEEKEIIHLSTPGVDTIALLEELDKNPKAGTLEDLRDSPSSKIVAVSNAPRIAHQPMAPVTEPEFDDSGIVYDDPEEADEMAEAEILHMVTDLRKDLVGVLKLFASPWTFADLKDWLDANGYTKGDVHDVPKLKEIIGKLEDSAAAGPAKKESIDMETGEVVEKKKKREAF